ncbi:hypothetical protein IQ225_16275, partial [Synechocystis salina LEGE 06155]|nr:hypothetical protein [Synechocystis salina LEGE 06155]
MALNFTNRLSAITTDFAGITHVVWAQGDNLWHAVYDPNSASWINAMAIADVSGQSIKSLNLVADPNLILESGSKGTMLPGLAVIYQEGKENDSNFFYTAALYNQSGDLEWLPTPQALTADQVGDLEPRAIVNNGSITVVGQKVDLVKAQNQAIREDTDLYYQTFQIQTNQFNQFVAPPQGQAPTASFNPPTSKDGVVQGYSVF